MTEKYIRYAYHGTIFMAGFVSLALELIAARALAPHVGTSLHVWGALLITSLVMIAIGYAWGEFSSKSIEVDRKPDVFIKRGLLASLFLLLASFFQYSFNIGLQVLPLLPAALIGSFIILGPALFFISSMTPLLIAMELVHQQNSVVSESTRPVYKGTPLGDGRAGLILAENTSGAVLGAFVTVYFILPHMAVDTGLALLSLPLLLSALLTRYIHKKLITKKTGKIALMLIICAVALMGLNQKLQARPEIRIGSITAEQKEVVYSPYGLVRILKAQLKPGQEPEYFWLMDGSTQNRMVSTGQHPTAYTNAIVNILLNLENKPEEILLLGGGAGLIARDLHLAGRTVTIVDILKEAEQMAREYFALPQEIQYITSDARHFVNRCDSQYGAIVYDLYGAYSVPDNAYTQEAFEAVKNCLKEDGVLIINTLRMPSYMAPDKILGATLKKIFPYIDFLTTKKENIPLVNGLWLASSSPLGPLKLTGGNEPDSVRRELRNDWYYKTPPKGGAVSKDARPLYLDSLFPIMDKERRFAFRVYGPEVMRP